MSTTTAAVTEQIPSSRTEQDPERVAKGQARDHIDGVPVYGWGQAPPYLRTQTQLGELRLKLAQGQTPLAYIRTRKYGDVALYDPAGAEKMRPLPSSTQRRMAARRTCPTCQKVRDHIVHGERCGVCWRRAEEEQRRTSARTCRGCKAVRERPLPTAHGRCGDCRTRQLAEQRAAAVAWVEKVTVCAGAGCAVKVVSKTAARAYQKGQGPGRTGWYRAAHWPKRCAPCEAVEEQRQAEQRAEYERQEQERREERLQAAEDRKRWAAAALVAPDVVVLDTETSGLHPEARILEIAVVSSSGEVLLDTLLDPGEPVPRDSSEIHGITDADLAGKPRFSDALLQLTTVLDGKRCLIYNKWFDIERLRYELTRHYVDSAVWEPAELAEGRAMAWAREKAEEWLGDMKFEDVMSPYSDWVGDWSEFHGNNRWQPLNGGHRAVGDCLAVLDRLRSMGRDYESEYALASAGAGTGEGEAG